MVDWIGDPDTSREEKLDRFERLYRKVDTRMFFPEQCCPDGYCFEGLGIHNIDYGSARHIELTLFAVRAQAWDEGYEAAMPEYIQTAARNNPYLFPKEK